MFSSQRWILLHEHIASFCKAVQPVPLCHGEEMQNWPIMELLWLSGADSLPAHWVSTSVWEMSVLRQEVLLQIHRNMNLYGHRHQYL